MNFVIAVDESVSKQHSHFKWC